MNHTKGEWIKEGAFIFSSEKPPRLIAEVIRPNMSLEEQQANAHLIAAGPAMYEALKDLLWDLKQGAIPNDLTFIEEALAKAEGKA